MAWAEPPAVRARDLARRFGAHWALAHVDLEVARGAALLLAGANGSGKTTLLRLIAGLHAPTRGELEVLGHRLPEGRLEARRELSLVSHSPYLYARLTALETVRLWARLLGLRRSAAALREELDRVGIADRADVPVGGFSAGMRKRLTMVRIRLEDPSLILLDEPFSALDPAGRAMVEEWVRTLHAAGKTLIIASHELERAARLCDDAVALELGQIRWRGAARELDRSLDFGSGA